MVQKNNGACCDELGEKKRRSSKLECAEELLTETKKRLKLGTKIKSTVLPNAK